MVFILRWPHKTITTSFDVAYSHRQDFPEVVKAPWIREKVALHRYRLKWVYGEGYQYVNPDEIQEVRG